MALVLKIALAALLSCRSSLGQSLQLCRQMHCVDDVCTPDGCQNGCAQWYVGTVTTSGYNCSRFLPELDSTAPFYVSEFSDSTVHFHVEMESQIDAELQEYYSYSIEHSDSSSSGDSDFTSIKSINHASESEFISVKVKLKLETDSAHWFRVRIMRSQNEQSSSGQPSHVCGLFIAEKDKSSAKADETIIPLVVLLTLFVTGTVVLGVLANYLAGKRLAPDTENPSKDSNVTFDDKMSCDMAIADENDTQTDDATVRHTLNPVTVTKPLSRQNTSELASLDQHAHSTSRYLSKLMTIFCYYLCLP